MHKIKYLIKSESNGYGNVTLALFLQIFATLATFYVPLAIILILYWRIFQAAQKRIRRKQNSNLRTTMAINGPSAAAISIISETTLLAPPQRINADKIASSSFQPSQSSIVAATAVTAAAAVTADGGVGDGTDGTTGPATDRKSITRRLRRRVSKRRNVESKRERKAAKTLAIITGAFIVCWLPFFVIAVLLPFCPQCFNDTTISFFLWLGYFNSTLNPILYTIFSPEFRNAFQKLLRIQKNGAAAGNSGNGTSRRFHTSDRRSVAVPNDSTN